MATSPPDGSVEATTRLCVKNLPKHCDEKQLRAHFNTTGDVTDVRIIRTQQGKSRQFGFVGFRSVEAAAPARKFFTRSYIDTSRIEIDVARRSGDSTIARPWSRHSKGSSAYLKAHPEEAPPKVKAPKPKAGGEGGKAKAASSKALEKAAKDPRFAEFLQLMGGSKGVDAMKVWNNDDAKGEAQLSSAEALRGKAAAPRRRGADAEEDGA